MIVSLQLIRLVRVLFLYSLPTLGKETRVEETVLSVYSCGYRIESIRSYHPFKVRVIAFRSFPNKNHTFRDV